MSTPTPAWGQQPDDAGQAAAKKVKERKDAAKGCGCLAALGLGVLLVIGACSASGTSSAGSTTPAVTEQATTAAASPVAATTAAAAPTTDPAVAVAEQVSSWWTGGGQSRVSQIQQDFTAIGTDATNQDVTSLTTDCASLTGDVTDAQNYAAIPDDEAQQHWSQALADYHQGAADCTAGAAAGNASLINQASGELTAGNTELGQATDRIKALGASIG